MSIDPIVVPPAEVFINSDGECTLRFRWDSESHYEDEDEDIAERVVRERKRSARVQHCTCEGGQTDPYDGPAADPDQIRAHEQRRGELTSEDLRQLKNLGYL